jgi:hypothetical protein
LPDLWKWTLTSELRAVILGILVPAWPGISILVAATLFAVFLLVSTLSSRFPAPARHGGYKQIKLDLHAHAARRRLSGGLRGLCRGRRLGRHR